MTASDSTIRSHLFSRGDGGTIPDRLTEVLQTELAADEEILHQLPGKSKLVHEEDGETEHVQAESDNGIVAIVTDRRLLFAVATGTGGKSLEIPYSEIRDIDVDDGLLRSKLSVRVWAEGTYTMKVTDSNALESAVTYLTEASDIWRQVVAIIQDVDEARADIETGIEAGELRDVHETRDKTIRKLYRAQSRLQAADIESEYLREQIEEAREEFHRAEIRARVTRAKTLMTEARHQTDSQAYAGAYRSYWRARDHLENALMIAIDNDITKPALIQSELDKIETRLEHLEVRPLALAKQASERAMTTENLTDEVDAWEEAFQHYRDALTEGWGTPLTFVDDRDQLQARIETVVGNLLDARCALAKQLKRTGQKQTDNAEFEAAEQCYRRARKELIAAEQLATEFSSGDPDVIREQLRSIESNYEMIEWQLSSPELD